MNRSLLAVASLMLSFLLGCGGSPTEIVGAPLVFEGLVIEGGSVLHSLTVTRRGGARIEVTSLVADPPLADDIIPSLGFALGQLDAATGMCLATYSTGIQEGSQLSLGLEEREYCLRLFDNGTLAEGDTRAYSFTVTASE
jgi:hypothetical protein